MSMNISQKPNTSVGFSAISMKTYNKMLKDVGFTETIIYNPDNLILKLGKNSNDTETEQLFLKGKSIKILDLTLAKARQKITNMLSNGDILTNHKGMPKALVVEVKFPKGK